MARIACYTHPDFDLHTQGSRHPERPERTKALIRRLSVTEFWDDLDVVLPEPASVDDIALVHDRAYIERVERICEQGGGLVDGLETGVNRGSYRIAQLAVGAVTGAIDRVVGGKNSAAFCAVRPPGHHALQRSAMGFCLFNNAAIGARYARQIYGVERVLIVDWDFHHGNGTQETFWRDGSVMCFSVHCSPAYPYSGFADQRGEGPGEGLIVNAPLAPGAGHYEYADAFENVLKPAAERFEPDLVLISAGFDAHRSDPLSLMRIDEADFREFTDRVRDIADRFAGGRIVSVLEGGYNVDTLASSAEGHVRRLLA